MQIIGYLGPTGSYSEVVTQQLYPAHSTTGQFSLYPTLTAVIEALAQQQIDLAVLPLENNQQGLVKDNLEQELLTQVMQQHWYIIKEKFLPMELLLLGLPGATIAQLEAIHVNLYAELQCKSYLQQSPHWQIITHPSSSTAAQYVKQQQLISHAAIASPYAASHYGLIILEANMLVPSQQSIMRFGVISRTPLAVDTANTSLAETWISSFAVKTPDFNRLLSLWQQRKIPISLIRKSHVINNSCYVDLWGIWDTTTLSDRADQLQLLGTFPACPQRMHYAPLFYRE